MLNLSNAFKTKTHILPVGFNVFVVTIYFWEKLSPPKLTKI